MINDFDFQGVKFRYMVIWDVSGFIAKEQYKENYVVEGGFQSKYSAKEYYDFLQGLGTINKNRRFIIEVDDNGKASRIKL